MPRPLARNAALLLLASAVSACGCPDIGYRDSVLLRLDAPPVADEAWELTFSADDEPPCTLVLTPDAVEPVEAAPGCAPYIDYGADLRPGGIYDVALSGGFKDYTPRAIAVTLVIDGATVIDTTYRPSYETVHPDGPLCHDYEDGEVIVRLPER